MSSVGSRDAATTRVVEITVNGEPTLVRAPHTVSGLLDQLALSGRKVAVAVDREVIPRSRYGDARLLSGQHVEILEAVGGG